MVSLLAAGLAGCLNAQSDDGPALISRVHSMTVDRATQDAAERHGDDVQALLREVLHTDLVVRVDEAGDYVLEYTDKSGAAQRQTLSGMTPGEPRTVSGADPLAPAVLKRGEEIVVTRAGQEGAWWHVGDIPLGFNMTEGARGTYKFTSMAEEGLSLTDLNVEEQQIAIQSAEMQIKLPIEGTFSYDLASASGADGAPLTLIGSVEVPPSAGDLVTLEVTATMNGETGTAGTIAGVDQARATGSLRSWWSDGQPVASQFLGGQYSADPRAIAWADGFFTSLAEGQNCAGKTKADRCEPEQLESVEESVPAEEKEVFNTADFPKAEDEASRQATAIMQQLFALDIVRGDKLSIAFVMDESDFNPGNAPDGPRGSMRTDFTLEAVDTEDVSVPAGTFEALKITESIRTQFSIANVKDPETGEVSLQDFSMDEVMARNTFWLEVGTYRPVKMEASTPLDLDALLKRMLNSVAPATWEQIGGKPIENENWHLTMTAESTYEATEMAPATHYSALVGLTVAHAVASSASGPAMWALGLSGAGMGSMFGTSSPDYGYDQGYDYAEPAQPVEAEPVQLSLTSAGELSADGVKEYTISSASKGLEWGRLMVTVDGIERYMAYDDTGACPAVDETTFAACRAGSQVDYAAYIEAGDTLALGGVASGSLVRVLDAYSNSVIITMTVS